MSPTEQRYAVQAFGQHRFYGGEECLIVRVLVECVPADDRHVAQPKSGGIVHGISVKPLRVFLERLPVLGVLFILPDCVVKLVVPAVLQIEKGLIAGEGEANYEAY